MPNASEVIKRISIGILLISIIGGFVFYVYLQKKYYEHLDSPVDAASESRINFSVEQNEPPKQIAQRLFKENIIISDWAFYKYLKEKNLGPEIQAGKFILKRSYTIPQVVDFLTRARSEETVVTIREGLTLEEVDAHLTQEGIFLSGEFLKCARECEFEGYFFLDARPEEVNSLEGYLFADTYFVDLETVSPRSLIERMLDNFESKLSSGDIRSKIAETGKSIHQVITMASILEEEERKKGQKPIVAGILWKRLSENIPLGVDATIRYALKKWTEPLTKTDLEIDSPYNTRQRKGLPPTPISNFSMVSLEAALNPEESPYYYYLHDSEGNIHYAKTNEEHNANKRKYL